jgi:hypothetical protein
VGAVIRVGGPKDRQGAEFIALLQAHRIAYAGRPNVAAVARSQVHPGRPQSLARLATRNASQR